MGKVGRPAKYTPEQLGAIAKKFKAYIDDEKNVIPIIVEFCYKNNISRDTLYDHPDEFSTLLKKCIARKEAQLEKLCLLNKVNASMAIFSLKQLGWRDKQEIEQGGSIEVKITREIKDKGECE